MKDTNISYVKKPPTQLRRDTRRTEEFKRQTISKKRKADEDIETGRLDTDNNFSTLKESSQEAIFSPASVNSNTPEVRPLSLSGLSDRPPSP